MTLDNQAKFSKDSSPPNILYNISIKLTFENFDLQRLSVSLGKIFITLNNRAQFDAGCQLSAQTLEV